jgi:formamidase
VEKEYVMSIVRKIAISISVDRSKPLRDQPHIGHNRWHPDIRPIAEVSPGEVATIETLDAMDGQVQPHHTHSDIAKCDFNLVHPLTGPFYLRGAEPGDLLEVEVIDILPEKYGYTIQYPGLGFLRDEFSETFVLHWEIKGDFAFCSDLPRVRIPAITHMGVMGVAPSHDLLNNIKEREQKLLKRGGNVRPPDPAGAVPADPVIAGAAIRTISPHENGGNLDIKHLTKGAKLRIPVFVPGALFSTGDAHYCQGDGEACFTPIETGATLIARFNLLKGEAKRRNLRDVQFSHENYYAKPEFAGPKRFHATTGLSHNPSGDSSAEDLNMATRNALRNMVEYLVSEHNLTRQQAYAICSICVDLKMSQIVDAPNFMVSAVLPLDIFI